LSFPHPVEALLNLKAQHVIKYSCPVYVIDSGGSQNCDTCVMSLSHFSSSCLGDLQNKED